MDVTPKVIEELIEKLCRFPGIGKRSAERIVFYLLKMSEKEVVALADNILTLGRNIRPCRVCNNFSLQAVCPICADTRRDQKTICIVEEPKDLLAIEKTGQYKGLYYVLLGSISPLEGIGPEDLNVGKLMNILVKGQIKEVIIATDPDNDGELTAHYLIEKISRFPVKIFRIGMGIPLGTQIEYIDSATLGRALSERKILS